MATAMSEAMRGASSESLHTLTDAVDAAVAGGADGTQLGEELFGVATVLREEPALRRVLTDVSVGSEAKAGLVRQIFAGRLGEAAVELAARAVTLRWAGTRDLGDALERLGVVSLVQGADRGGAGDRLENELFGFQQLVADNPELRDALSNPARSAEDKRALLRNLLQDRVGAAVVRLAEQAVSGSHRTVELALEEYQKIAAAHRQRMVGTVRVARPLADPDRSRLEAVLSRQYSRPVHLNVVVDPAVLGGVRVEIGDDVIDGTVASRLDDARRRLAG